MPFLIIGLGNPGRKYTETRHNAGFWFLDRLADAAGLSFRRSLRLQSNVAKGNIHGRDCVLAKPRTFMNESGRAVRAVIDYYKTAAPQVLVAYDELDLPPGTVRLKHGGGHGGHNGLRDIFRHTTNQEFLRLRIGIGHPGHKSAVTGYVLSRPDAAQERLIVSGIDDALAVLPTVLDEDLPAAMKALHTEKS
ncbi:MAG: aminoacyl-tRNA hydrolase [Gammaproteobacteria bacterium]|nr:aminoacyl-tRNA hydrolase [Gammaproteobacteria bacterium]NNJ77624.1 aminoacyl-tRNA hydrolase [Xanthomonadales bacterium]